MPATPFDRPALRPADGGGVPGDGPVSDGGEREVMVEFLDKTWRLCRLAAWRRGRSAGVWWCLIRWTVTGDAHEAWFSYDPQRAGPVEASAGTAEEREEAAPRRRGHAN